MIVAIAIDRAVAAVISTHLPPLIITSWQMQPFHFFPILYEMLHDQNLDGPEGLRAFGLPITSSVLDQTKVKSSLLSKSRR
jgi:hypothetical protein